MGGLVGATRPTRRWVFCQPGRREVHLVGIDSVNIDDTRSGSRPAHTLLLSAGIPIVEHLTGLEALPETGFRFFATPPLLQGMGTFPVRAFARVA